jgi:hypothetical protein
MKRHVSRSLLEEIQENRHEEYQYSRASLHVYGISRFGRRLGYDSGCLADLFFLPLAIWVRLALAVLLTVVFVSCLIKANLKGQLRDTSSLCFYAAPATVILFLILIAAHIHSRDRIEEQLNPIYQALHRPSTGQMTGDSQRRSLLINRPKLELLASSQNIVNASILGFKVCSYNLQDLTYLFNEIFIDQEYFFVADSEKPFVIDCGVISACPFCMQNFVSSSADNRFELPAIGFAKTSARMD